MKIANILFNFKKSSNLNKVLGVERCFVDYGKGLKEQGHEVIAISKPRMIFADMIKDSGVDYYEVPAINVADFYSIAKLALILWKFKPDIIICHSGRALSLARVALRVAGSQAPTVAIDHGVNPKKFIKADFVLAVNKFFAKELEKFGKASDRALSIPNMIDVPQDFKTITKSKFPAKVRIGSLGRLYPEKNFDKVLKALPILRQRGVEASYVIGGVGPEQENLEKISCDLELGDDFRIMGWVDDKKTFFENIDIFILPSWGETFGIVLLEAMMYSTPIIASNSWGPDEIIRNLDNGIKVSKDDASKMPELIADAIEKLINDQDLAKKIAKNAYQEFTQQYTSQNVMKKLSDILEIAVKKGRDKKFG